MIFIKRWRFWLPLLAILALVVLAAGLSQMQFGSGFKIESSADSPDAPNALAPTNSSPSSETDTGKEIVVIFLWAFLIASILSIILWPESLKETLKRALTATVWVMAIYFVYSHFRRQDASNRVGSLGDSSQTVVTPQEALPGWNETQVPFWFTLLMVLLIVGGIAATIAAFFFIRRFWKFYRQDTLLEDVAGLAERAAHDLRAGAALRDVVLRCYHEMSLLLSQQKKIALSKAMTAREFEQRLQTLGVRNEHVKRLTQLFEKVRYGRTEPSELEEREAMACLDAISKAHKPAS